MSIGPIGRDRLGSERLTCEPEVGLEAAQWDGVTELCATHKADVNEVGGIPFETALHVAVQFWPQLRGRIRHRLTC